MKIERNPWTALFPCPVVLVTCVGLDGKPNIITLAWTGVVCSDPPMIGLSIRPHRHSYQLIVETGEFVVNIPTTKILKETDFCGTVSGSEIDKFSETGLTQELGVKVKPPLIKECPVNIECVLRKKITLGVHDLFIGEVLLVHVDKKILDDRKKIDFGKIAPFVYNQGEYWSLNKRINFHGFSRK